MNLFNVLANVSCAGYEFDAVLPAIISTLVTIIKIGIPLILIILGLLDLGKAVMANDEKVMKESQGRLIKRFVYAIIIFLLVAIVQLIFNMIDNANSIADSESGPKSGEITKCINCFINNKCGDALTQ